MKKQASPWNLGNAIRKLFAPKAGAAEKKARHEKEEEIAKALAKSKAQEAAKAHAAEKKARHEKEEEIAKALVKSKAQEAAKTPIFTPSRHEASQKRLFVPLMFYPPKLAPKLARPFFGLASRILGEKSFLAADLNKLDEKANPVEYMGMALLNSFSYFVLLLVVGFGVLNRVKLKDGPMWALAGSLFIALFILMFGMAYPKWMGNKKTRQIDRDLLYAARHLRIQTTAGVPLFNSLVSATSGYGAVSEELKKVVTKVQAGESLAYALEESAHNNPSYYYNRILWQMSNAVKAGSDIGPVLSEIVDFLAEEQRIEMRNYGAQLNTLAIMYLMMCIIVPTISLIFILVVSSFAELPITDTSLVFMIAIFAFIQYMFIGIIENRRPAVAI